MGYRNGAILAEEENGVSTSVNDALLFTTMCMIGHPVDVHVKDGSIYSGTLYTASVDNAYAVVLKKARRIKKGNRETNVTDGKLIETLVILSEDLVQVVAKELLLPAESVSGKVGEDCVGAGAGIVHENERGERRGNSTNHREPNLDKKDVNCSRHLDPIKNSVLNGFSNDPSMEVASQECDGIKRGNTESVSYNERQVGESSVVEHGSLRAEISEQAEETIGELVEGSRASLDACGSHSRDAHKNISTTNCGVKLDVAHVRHTLEESQQSLSLSSGVSVDATSDVHVSSDSSLNASRTSTKVVLPKKGNHGQATKESKLNPRAQLFSPSLAQHRSATPPLVSLPPSMNHSSESPHVVPTAAAETEADINSFTYRSSVPAKFAPHNNLYFVNGRSDIPYAQHLVGHAGSRMPPVRYAGQYGHLQAGPPYGHPSSQTVMAGRMGPLVYVHPVSNDVSQGTAVFSQLPSRPLMAPSQINIPKHQGK